MQWGRESVQSPEKYIKNIPYICDRAKIQYTNACTHSVTKIIKDRAVHIRRLIPDEDEREKQWTSKPAREQKIQMQALKKKRQDTKPETNGTISNSPVMIINTSLKFN